MGAAAAISGASAGGGIVGGMVGGMQELWYAKEILAPTLKDIGAAEAALIRKQGRKIGGQQVAAYAKAGVRTDVGTPLAVAADTAATVELDALRALFSYEHQAWTAKMQGTKSAISGMMGIGGASGVGNLVQAMMSRSKTGSSSVPTTFYGQHGSAVNITPTPYSTNYGSYA